MVFQAKAYAAVRKKAAEEAKGERKQEKKAQEKRHAVEIRTLKTKALQDRLASQGPYKRRIRHQDQILLSQARCNAKLRAEIIKLLGDVAAEKAATEAVRLDLVEAKKSARSWMFERNRLFKHFSESEALRKEKASLIEEQGKRDATIEWYKDELHKASAKVAELEGAAEVEEISRLLGKLRLSDSPDAKRMAGVAKKCTEEKALLREEIGQLKGTIKKMEADHQEVLEVLQSPVIVAVQARARGALHRRLQAAKKHAAAQQQASVVGLQAQARGQIVRLRLACLADSLHGSRHQPALLQALARGCLERRRGRSVDQGLRAHAANDTTALQSAIRGALERQRYRRVGSSLEQSNGEFTRLFAALQGCLARKGIRGQQAALEQVGTSIMLAQALVRGALARRSMRLLEEDQRAQADMPHEEKPEGEGLAEPKPSGQLLVAGGASSEAPSVSSPGKEDGPIVAGGQGSGAYPSGSTAARIDGALPNPSPGGEGPRGSLKGTGKVSEEEPAQGAWDAESGMDLDGDDDEGLPPPCQPDNGMELEMADDGEAPSPAAPPAPTSYRPPTVEETKEEMDVDPSVPAAGAPAAQRPAMSKEAGMSRMDFELEAKSPEKGTEVQESSAPEVEMRDTSGPPDAAKLPSPKQGPQGDQLTPAAAPTKPRAKGIFDMNSSYWSKKNELSGTAAVQPPAPASAQASPAGPARSMRANVMPSPQPPPTPPALPAAATPGSVKDRKIRPLKIKTASAEQISKLWEKEKAGELGAVASPAPKQELKQEEDPKKAGKFKPAPLPKRRPKNPELIAKLKSSEEPVLTTEEKKKKAEWEEAIRIQEDEAQFVDLPDGASDFSDSDEEEKKK